MNEERVYFDAAQSVGIAVLAAYERALVGLRASKRGESPIKPRDPFLVRDVATMLIDCRNSA